MINYATIDIRRGVMHHINAKVTGQEHASVRFDPTPFSIDDALKKVIRERLVTAAGKDSRAFELEIENDKKHSFFDQLKDAKNLDDKKFYAASKKIAELLAQSQTRNNIPGGVFILLDCTIKLKNIGLYIVIKAELHDALMYQKVKGKSKLQVLNEIFLSPSQKLYKVGILIERKDAQKNPPNDSFTCFLFDEQFRIDGSKPAEYFYKDFLGFTVDSNAKIQIKRFYDNTSGFIYNHISKPDEINVLINALYTELKVSQAETVSPYEFAKKYFKDDEIIELYRQSVSNYLPATISRETVLVDGSLSRKKINFPNNIKVTGETEGFDENVHIIDDKEGFDLLDYKDCDYTILKITGKPFSNA
jgi:hypothetical protein